jgi:8-oxo-dGTP diphosphatase
MASAEYINSLPRKIVGAAAIFFNKNKELLIVKPNYRKGWLVPGGGVDALESPRDGCIREIKEEVGLDIKDLKFVCVQYNKNFSEDGAPYDAIQFVFFGGVLSDEQISQIVLAEKELDEFRFCKIEEALTILSGKLSTRIKIGIDMILKDPDGVYSENSI